MTSSARHGESPGHWRATSLIERHSGRSGRLGGFIGEYHGDRGPLRIHDFGESGDLKVDSRYRTGTYPYLEDHPW